MHTAQFTSTILTRVWVTLTLYNFTIRTGTQMAKPNYAYEKRQKELAKKQKKEEKQQQKNAPDNNQTQEPQAPQPDQQNTAS